MDHNDKQKHPKKPILKWRSRDYVVLAVIFLFIASWYFGKQNFKAHIDPFFKKAWPEAESYKFITENHAEVLDKNGRFI